MSDRIEPSTHIDVRVVRNLLISRLNEGRDLMKLASVSTKWKKGEKLFQEKCRQAIKLIDDAINIKEDNYNENPVQTSGEGNESTRKTSVQNEENKA